MVGIDALDLPASAQARWPSRRVALEAGELLFAEGDLAHTLYRVEQGVLTLSRTRTEGRRQVVGFALANDVVGAAAGGRFRQSALAAGEVVVQAIPQVGAGLDEPASTPLLERELAMVRDQLRLLDGAPEQRVADFLLMIHARMPQATGQPDLVPLPMPRRDIADYLGLTLEGVGRALSALIRSGAVAAAGEGIRLRDPHRLGRCSSKRLLSAGQAEMDDVQNGPTGKKRR